MVVTSDEKTSDAISPSLASAAMSFPPPPQFQGLMPPSGLKIPRFGGMMMDDTMKMNPFGFSLPFTSMSHVPYLKPVSPKQEEHSEDDKAGSSDDGKNYLYVVFLKFSSHHKELRQFFKILDQLFIQSSR